MLSNVSEERNDFAMSVAEAREHGGRRQTVERGRLLRTIMTGMYGPGENVVQSDANRKRGWK